MKNTALTFLLIFAFALHAFGSEPLIDKIKFAAVEEANALLSQEDQFTKSWSQFDIDSRMQKQNSSREELFDHIISQTREWSEAERKTILSVVTDIDKEIKVNAYKLNFPDEIYFVKTTTAEEGGAGGYTRANYIVIKDQLLVLGKEPLKHIVAHELFHVLTRNNPEFRKEMYEIIGFRLMNEIAYPESLADYRITNPDAPQTDSYISLKVKGESKKCMMILYSDKDYDEGDFFEYLNIGFLSITGDSIMSVEFKNDKPVIYSLKEVSGFFEKVGKNTQYIIHPEEILADNFTFLILGLTDLPNTNITDEIKKKLVE